MKIILLAAVILLSCCFIYNCNTTNPVSSDKTTIPDEEKSPAVIDIPDDEFNYDSLTVEEITAMILGEWEWTHTIIKDRGTPPPYNKITPKTEGYKLQRIFRPDSVVEYYKDGALTGSYNYFIRKGRVLPTDPWFTFIAIGGFSYLLKFYHPNYMMYGNGFVDGADSYFLRKR